MQTFTSDPERVSEMQGASTSGALCHPVELAGNLDHPSRWLWLVKWLLAIPHYFVLAFLWLGFVLLSVAAFFVLLFGGRYPRGIFEFNLGVLRWNWRVAFYAFSANGTDRYPPFTLADVPDYPARVDIHYPEDQRHGLPLVGWWLAGIPQYIVAGIFAGGGGAVGWGLGEGGSAAWGGGLIGLLVLVALLVLLFRGEYPRSIFDLVLGLNRWVLRVGAYAALMTREYPPFRLDAGGDDPSGLTSAARPAGSAAEGVAVSSDWGPGRVLAVLAASLVVLLALAGFAAGVTAVVFDQTQRDAGGYLMTRSTSFSTDTYALVSETVQAGTSEDWAAVREFSGTVRLRSESDNPIFMGIAPAAEVEAYLGAVRREVATRFDADRSGFRREGGQAPPAPPAATGFWAAQATGSGQQELHWTPREGEWRFVVMNADASPAVAAEVRLGAQVPHLLAFGLWLMAGAAVVGLLGSLGLYAAVRSRSGGEE
jgi:hypothetical protein